MCKSQMQELIEEWRDYIFVMYQKLSVDSLYLIEISSPTKLLFNLPYANRPGIDRICKGIVSNRKFKDIISSVLLNAEPGVYRLDGTEWSGARSDVVLSPSSFDDDNCPIIIEFKRVVGQKLL